MRNPGMRYPTPDIGRPFESLVTMPVIAPAIAASVTVTAKTVIMITFFIAQHPHFFKKTIYLFYSGFSHLYLPTFCASLPVYS
jgi:hypothetical protein